MNKVGQSPNATSQNLDTLSPTGGEQGSNASSNETQYHSFPSLTSSDLEGSRFNFSPISRESNRTTPTRSLEEAPQTSVITSKYSLF